jgi:hypothetical protein
MSEPTLISRDALSGKKVALSVSESADLARLGLTEQHCRLVVAEVGRAIMLAGGNRRIRRTPQSRWLHRDSDRRSPTLQQRTNRA